MPSGGRKLMKKRFITLILSIVIIIAALAVISVDVAKFVADIKDKDKTDDTSSGDEKDTVRIEGFELEVNDTGGLTVTKYSGKDREVTIPSNVAGKNVTEIGTLAFNSTPRITSVKIPDTIAVIGNMAFLGCSSIEEINIPRSVSEIRASAFRGCSALKYVNFEGGEGSCLRIIERFAFASCRRISNIELPQNLYAVEDGAFSLCVSLESINTGKGLRYMGESVFSGCESLTHITVDSENCVSYGTAQSPAFCQLKNITDLTFAEGVKCIGSYLALGLTEISSVVLPEGLEKVGDYSFYGCTGIDSISLPESTVSVGEYAFAECDRLSSIDFNDGLENIGNNAILGTLWYDSLEDGPIYMGNALFGYKGEMNERVEIVVREGTASIADNAFAEIRNALSVTLPKSIKRIGRGAFSNCSFPVIFSDMSLNAAIKTIGERAFEGYRGANISIPASVSEIGQYAFSGCRSNIIFPSDGSALTEIGERAFSKYAGQTLNIPSYIVSIGKEAFYDTYADVTFSENPRITSLGERAFAGYRGFYVMLPDSIETIGKECFLCSSVLAVFGDNSRLKEIGAESYKDYEGSIIFVPKSVKRIDDTAFVDCYSLVILGYYGSEAEYKKVDVGSRAYVDLDYLEIEYNFDYTEYIGEDN